MAASAASMVGGIGVGIGLIAAKPKNDLFVASRISVIAASLVAKSQSASFVDSVESPEGRPLHTARAR
jgi:hypothetical protein